MGSTASLHMAGWSGECLRGNEDDDNNSDLINASRSRARVVGAGGFSTGGPHGAGFFCFLFFKLAFRSENQSPPLRSPEAFLLDFGLGDFCVGFALFFV